MLTILELAFDTRELRKLCESESAADRELGIGVATKLRNRLADIDASQNVEELASGRPQKQDGDPPTLTLHLSKSCSVTFCANHSRPRTNPDGTVDWSRVTRIKLIKIGDHHAEQ